MCVAWEELKLKHVTLLFSVTGMTRSRNEC